MLLLTASLAIFFSKINKRGFYHHYFRVIEEVESRNSQEVAPAHRAALQSPAPAFWRMERLLPLLRSLFWAVCAMAPLLWVPRLQPLAFAWLRPQSQLQLCHLRTHPARAP